MTWSPPDARRSPGSSALPTRASSVLRSRRDDLLALVVTVAVSVLLGAPVGILWSALAPHAHVSITASDANVVDGATEVFIAGDGWFVGITLLVGVVCGALAWVFGRRSGPWVAVGLCMGGLLAAYVASKVGIRIGQDALENAIHARRIGSYVANVALQAKVAIVVWPLGALIGFAVPVVARVDDLD